ncbi:MAG: iron-containing alcohol dehydrogenase [Planctomycetota bacterium]|jgi:glycerol-1-phosphate dehydrogenase [NAD(P)+]
MTQLKYDPTKITQLKELIQLESKGESFDEITLEKMVIGKHMIEQLPAIMAEISDGDVKEVLVVSDETQIKRGEDILKDLIGRIFAKKGIRGELLCLRADNTNLLHADMAGVKRVQSKIDSRTGIIGIGGGTITDICKYATFLSLKERPDIGKIPLVICQTATSGSAFGANQAVIFIEGVKRTLQALYPTVVLVDLDVIESAPRNLNIAGFGDMSGILISSVDWYVSNMLGMSDGYSELVVNIMQDSGQALLAVDRKVGDMSPEGIAILAKILVMMGIVSSMGFGTAPISGFDHMISHALDFESLATGRKLSLHGAQVGLGAAYASVAYQQFMTEFSPDKIDVNLCYPSEKTAHDEVVSRFGHIDLDGKSVKEIWTHYKEKLTLWNQKRSLFEKFLADWNKAEGPKDQISAKLTSAEKIIEALYISGNPTLPEELTPPISAEQMKFAFLNARFMRNRFVMSDIMGLVGMMNDGFWKRVDSEVRRILKNLRS